MTTTKYFVYPYTQHSAGSIMIAEELDGKRVKLHDSKYVHKPENVLINWGNGNCPYPAALNPASAINEVIDKVAFFKKLYGFGLTPPVAFTKTEAATLPFPVVCRTLTEAKDGEGIVIADKPEQLVSAKLYTSYIDKTSEYRIHVGRKSNGEVVVICRQKKYKTDDFKGDGRIWTGPETKFSFIETAVPPVIYAAKAAFEKFPELTFGAFDIVYDNSSEKAYILEINSAPMMNSDTTKAYGVFFRTFEGKTSPTKVSVPTPVEAKETTVKTTVNPTPTTTTQATTTNSGLAAFVKAQLSAGHITKSEIEKYTPPVTEEILIQNYVNAITKL